MSSNYILSKLILDASFSKICELLKWKSKLEEKYYYRVDMYYHSSKTCNQCGEKCEIVNDLSIRNWECDVCGNLNDWDLNASINMKFLGLRLYMKNN